MSLRPEQSSALDRLLPMSAAILIFGVGPVVAGNAVPDAFIGAWGDETSCKAYHRSDLYYRLSRDGRFELVGSERYARHFSDQCGHMVARSADALELKCQSGHTIHISRERNRLGLNYSREKIGSKIFLRKCGIADLISGIGFDPANVQGDLGKARQRAFAFGYASKAAQLCRRQLDGEATLKLLQGAKSAAIKYANSDPNLFAETFAKRLSKRNIAAGMQAADKDAGVISPYCPRIEEAFGANGSLVEGLFRPK